jgi:hypothetical protein
MAATLVPATAAASTTEGAGPKTAAAWTTWRRLQALERLIDGGAQTSRDRLSRARGAQRGDAPQEQRIPAGDSQEHEEQSRVKVTEAVGGQELRRLSQVEVAQAERRSLPLDLVEQGGAAIAAPLVASPRDDQSEPQAGQGPGHEPQQQQGAGVGGVDVIDDHARRRSAARRGELIGDGHESAEAAGLGSHHASVAFEQLQGVSAAKPGQDLLPRPQRRRPAVDPATGIDDTETAVLGPAHRLFAEAGLADARFPGHHDQRAVAPLGGDAGGEHLAQLVGSPEEPFCPRKEPSARAAAAGTPCLHAGSSVNDPGTRPASTDWKAAISAPGVGELPNSGGKRRMFRLAASPADQAPVSFGEAISGSGDRNVGLLAKAVRHTSGRRLSPIASVRTACHHGLSRPQGRRRQELAPF